MSEDKASIAQRCLDGAKGDTMTFPQIVQTLLQAGFDSYAVDFRSATATYFPSEGDGIVLPMGHSAGAVAPSMDAVAIQLAIREAQQLPPGYTYSGFCAKVVAAGCAGYFVSFTGRRVLYIGRTAETHVETFPEPSS